MDRREFGRRIAGTAFAEAVGQHLAWAAATPPTPPLKFSVMLWILSKTMTMEQRLDVVAAAGYNGGEMVAEWMKWSPEEKKRVIAKKNALNLTFDAMFPSLTPLNDPALRTKMRDEVTQCIPLARELGCPMFLMKSGSRIATQSPEQQKAEITESLKVAGDVASKAGIQLLLEPIDLLEDKHSGISSVSEGFEITRAVGNPMVKVLYDLYHEQRQAGNLIEKLERNFDQVGLVHIADVPGRYRPGTGEMNYTNIYRKLAELHYNRYITMEFYAKGDPAEELRAAKAEVLAAMKPPDPAILRPRLSGEINEPS